MNHFEMTTDELTIRIRQFERQYYTTILSNNDISYEQQVYFDYIKEEIELCKKELEYRKWQMN